MKILLSSILLSFLLLAGCATSAKYQAILTSWVDRDINELITEWGYPTRSMVLPNGNTVYIYETGATHVTPVQSFTTYHEVDGAILANTHVMGGDAFATWCRTFFEVNKENKVVKWQAQGNSCVSHKRVEPAQQ